MHKYLILISLLFFGCENKNEPTSTAPKPDSYTFATPNGGELPPAERGPIRDVFEPPPINLETFRLTVDGSVENPLSISWRQIKEWKSVTTDTSFMYCVEGWEVWGVWKGISVKELLNLAKPLDGASHVMFHGADGYTTAMPINYLVNYNSLLAYDVNGEPLKVNDGYPLRLTAFGLFGYKWAKYVTRLEVINKARLGFWEEYGYDDKAVVPLERRQFYEGPDARLIEF